jgi:hypothetical protein
MNHKRFNRHEVFDTFLMEWHSTTIRNVSNYIWETQKEVHSELENMLCGIWDGYLYNNLLETAKQVGLPMEDVRRIESTISVIEEYIESNPNTVTKIF